MKERKKPLMTETISCEQCLKEVPKSGAVSAEASDYTMYFCGLECFHHWQEGQKKNSK